MAGRIKGITIEIGGDVTKLDKALRDVNNSIKDTQGQLKDVERLLKLDPGNTELLAQKQQLLAKAVEETSKKLETLKEAERQAQEQLQRGQISQEQYQGLQREIIATELKLNDLEDQAKKTGTSFEDVGAKALALADKLKDGLATAAKAAAKGFEAVESVGKKTEEAVTTALKGFATAATAVAGFGTSAVKTGMEFDAAMSQIAATLGLTTQDIENNVNGAGDTFDLLRQKALDMGSSTNFTSKEAADGLNILAMSGYDAYESMDMIEDVLHLAAAGSMDMANAAEYVSGAMKGFNDETKDSAYYADLIAKGVTLANTSVAELGASLSDGAATAKTYGQSAETTTLALLRLAEQGETGTAASTALAAAMKNLYAPTNSAKKAMQELGVNAFDPTTGAARDFNVVVDELNSALSGYTDEQRTAYAQTIFGIQGFNAYNKMVVTSTEKVDEWAAALENAAGEAARQYDTMTDNLLGDLDKLSSAFEGLQIVVSDALTPMVREFAQFGASAMDALRKGFEDGGVTGFMSALTGIATNGVTMLAGKAPEFVSVSFRFVEALATGLLGAKDSIITAFNKSADALISGADNWLTKNGASLYDFGMRMINSIFNAFSGAGNLISEHIGQFVSLIANAFLSYHEMLFTVGIDILGAIGRGIVENKAAIQELASSTIANMVRGLQENAPMIIEGGLALLEALVGAILDNASYVAETAVNIISELAFSIGKAAPDLIPSAIEAVLKFIEGLTNPESLNNLIDGALQLMEGLGEGIIKSIPMLIAYGPEIVVSLVTGIISALPQLLVVGVQLVQGLVEGLIQGVVAIPAAVARVVGAIVDGFKALFGIHSPSTVMAEMGVNLIDGLLQGISGEWNTIVEFFASAAENLISFLGAAWNSIKEAAGTAWDAVRETVSVAWTAITSVWNAAAGFFGGIWDSIRSVGSGAAEAVQSAFSRAWDAVTSAWNGAISFFGGIWSSITGVFSNAWDLFSNIGGNIVNGIKNGISAAWNSLTSWVSGLFSSLVKSVKSLLGIASPSKVFAGIGSNMALGIEAGWDDEYKAIKDKIVGGLDFNAASVGLTANTSYSAQRTVQDGQQGNFGGSGDTYVTINSPVAVDPVQAAREWKKTTQRMAMGYV